MSTLFPLGLAAGKQFCNRENERELLKQHILAGRHTWITAPRRYGKTSLVKKVEQDTQKDKPIILFAYLDLFAAVDVESTQTQFFQAISDLTSQILPKSRQTLESVMTYFSALKPELSLTASGPKLSLNTKAAAQNSLPKALKGLDQCAAQFKKRCVIVIDEFQNLANLPNSQSLEGAIRHAVERAEYVTYLFSGSQRSLLAQMFESKTRPLYNLCSKLQLERIKPNSYASFLDDRAKMKWNKPLKEEVFKQIIDLTYCHPFYVNKLCGLLWESKTTPSLSTVKKVWSSVLQEEHSNLTVQLSQLSRNQQKLLVKLAKYPTNQPGSKEFIQQVNMAFSSVNQSLKVLLNEDIIYQDEKEIYRLINPAHESILVSTDRA